jgi:hypothetical protein
MLTSRTVAADTGKPEVVVVGKSRDTAGRPLRVVFTGRKLTKDTSTPVGPNVRFVVDGEMKPVGFMQDSLSPDKIYAIDVIKGERALQLYGENGKYGVVTIMTKAFREKHEPGTTGAGPLYIIDGVEYTGKDALKTIKPGEIDSVHILKNEQATIRYGEKGRNGVVVIRLKKKTAYQSKITFYEKDGPMSVIADSFVTKVNGERAVITVDRSAGGWLTSRRE